MARRRATQAEESAVAERPRRTSRVGTLIAIGGGERRAVGAAKTILHEVAATTAGQRLALVTAASREPDALVADYRAAFADLGLRSIDVLDIRSHADAYRAEHLRLLRRVRTVFFTGGDQQRITSLLGGTPVLREILAVFQRGGAIAGTSAGAAAMATTMLTSGSAEAGLPAGAVNMAPGLGLLREVVIDTHFGERGRMDRLLKAIARNPAHLGIGLDEDTGIVIDGNDTFSVVGSAAVRVLDCSAISYSSLSDRGEQGILGLHHVVLHVLGPGDRFDLAHRMPLPSLPPAHQGLAPRFRARRS